ncbi:MAG TPA: sulfatase [bacterium]|nr:sulfatase [bacterium]
MVEASAISRFRIVLHGVPTGILAGMAAGVADAWTVPHAFLDRGFLGLAVTAWVLCWAPAGLALGLLGAAVADPGRTSGPRSPVGVAALISAFALVASAWFLVVVHVNVAVLASDTGREALLFDAGSLVAALGLLLAVAHFLDRSFRRAGSPLRRLLLAAPGPLAPAAVLLLVGAAAWRGGVGAVEAPTVSAPADAPNVVLVLIDTLRRDHLSGEGYGRDTSPALDALAARGARFPDFVSQSCYTKPAVASLITSLHPSGHGVGHLSTVLSEERRTLAEVFHGEGWRTAKFVANTIIGPEFGFAQGTEVFRTLPTELIPRTRLGYALFRLTDRGRSLPGFTQLAALLGAVERRTRDARGAELIELRAPEAIAAFREWRATLGGDAFFAYLHVMEPHAPYRPPPDEAERFAEGVPLQDEHPPTVGLFLPFARADELPPERRDGLVRAYDAEIAGLDRELAGFLSELMTEGDRPTIVAVTSDHGEEFYEHGGWGHGQSLYEELLEIPLVIAGPGVPAGVEVPGPAQIIDVAPTLLDLAGVAVPPDMAGRSLSPAMQAAGSAGGAAMEPDAAVDPGREHLAEIVYGPSYWARSLRSGRWKTVVSRLGDDVRVQLFDLVENPGETRDLAAEDPERAARMAARIEELTAAAAAGRGSEETAEFDSVTRERLKALGYVE